MCGIVGFAGFSQPELLAKMSAAVIHRGPDGSGEFCTRDLPDDHPEVSMAIRRLAIIDLKTGDQPMTRHDCTVVFNGEIYNFIELRESLVAAGNRFSTTSDTEVLLHGYREWGWEGLLERLNGMFAFAIYDAKIQELLIARDRVGQKPLYYAFLNGRLLFGSEIKALLDADFLSRDLNHASVDQFLTLRYVPQPETLLRDVHVLPGGHSLRYHNGQIGIDRYWSPPITRQDHSLRDDLRSQFEELLDGAVSRTMRSDVPVSAYLSAGVDSGLLVSTMLQQPDSPFSGRTFSLGFGSPVDESAKAAELAKHFGLEHTDVRMTADDFSELPRVLYHLERPIGEPLVLAFDRLAKEASAHGKVVISGEGADELFAGYSFHRVIRMADRYFTAVPDGVHHQLFMPLLRAMPVAILNRFFSFPAYLGDAGKERFVKFMGNYRRYDLGANYVALRSLMDIDDRTALYSREFRGAATSEWIHRVGDVTARPLERLLNLQYHDWLQDFALLRQDKLSMAHGLEVRLPYLDHTLIDFAASLPERCKLQRRRNKSLLREVARRRLPRKNANRKKQAFYFPLESLYRNRQFQEIVNDYLDEERIRSRGIFDVGAIKQLRKRAARGEFLVLKQVMAIVMLEMWMQIFLDKKRMW